MWPVRYQGLDRGIERAKDMFGNGPYVVVLHARSLDIDGMTDAIELVSPHAELASGRAALESTFARACEAIRDDPSWHDEPPNTSVDLDPGHGVRLVEQRAIKRKDSGGFNAETRIVQLLEVSEPPIVGVPLFRALHYADELALHLARYR